MQHERPTTSLPDGRRTDLILVASVILVLATYVGWLGGAFRQADDQPLVGGVDAANAIVALEPEAEVVALQR